MLPAPGQGALAVQCRLDDRETLDLLAPLEDQATRKAVTAERAFLSGLGGGCSVPVAAYAKVEGKTILLTGLVISEDGKKAIHVKRTGTDANVLGNELAQRAIAQGANEILAASVMQ
jgi:hydroxymethylbilane synthase